MPESRYLLIEERFGEEGQWYNVGIVVAGTGKPSGTTVELYKNGGALGMSSLPVERHPKRPVGVNPNPGIYFGTAAAVTGSIAAVGVPQGAVSLAGKLASVRSLVGMSRIASCERYC